MSDSNLIINYLPQNLTEDQLRHLFLPYGNIETVKIVKEKITQRSLGYGFVKYSSDAEAKAAIDALNGRKLENKTLKVAVAKPPGAEHLCNLYVAGLEPHVTKDDLFTLFQSYGNVLETKLLHDKTTGQARGVGFVKFETPQEAEKSIKALDGMMLAGASKPLTVRVADKKDQNKHQQNGNNMIPFGVPPAGPAGRNVRYNPMAYFPQQGYQVPPAAFNQGFPQYQQQQQQQMGGNLNPNTPAFCLFVYNLPPESDERYLYQLFGPYGAVAQVKIARDPSTNLCKGFGFVNMVKFEDAQSAIAALNGAQIGNKTLQVSFKKDK